MRPVFWPFSAGTTQENENITSLPLSVGYGVGGIKQSHWTARSRVDARAAVVAAVYYTAICSAACLHSAITTWRPEHLRKKPEHTEVALVLSVFFLLCGHHRHLCAQNSFGE